MSVLLAHYAVARDTQPLGVYVAASPESAIAIAQGDVLSGTWEAVPHHLRLAHYVVFRVGEPRGTYVAASAECAVELARSAAIRGVWTAAAVPDPNAD